MIRTQVINLGAAQYFIHREHSFTGHDSNGWYEAHSEILVCPRCHKSWAELLFVDDQDWWPTSAYCEQCNVKDDWHPVPGSILVEEGYGVIDTALLAALPKELVEREFKLHIEAYSP